MRNKAIKSGIWFTISNFLMKAIAFIITPIFTRLMTKTEFGDFNNFQTWMMILLYITSLDLEGSLIRACHEFKDKFDEYLYSMICLSMLSTLIWFGVVNVFFDKIFEILSINRFYTNCMFLYLMFCPAINIFQNAERFKYHYKWTVITSMVVSISTSLISVILVWTLQDKLYGRIVGYIIPTIVIGMVIFLYFTGKVKHINIKYWKYALKITIPYIPHLLSMYLLSNMDKVMIRQICGSEAVALYSLAYTCGMLITMLVSSINNAYSPWLAEKLNEKKYDEIKRMSFPYVLVFSFLAIGAVLVTPEILLILGGKSYMEAKYVMAPVAAGCLLQFIYCMYVNIEQFEKRTVGMAIGSVCAALLNFVLNYYFIRKYGYTAAAYTTYISYLFLLFVHIFIVKKIGMIFVYDNIKMVSVAIIASIIIFLANTLLELTLFRYIVILVYFIVLMIICFLNKDKILRLMK